MMKNEIEKNRLHDLVHGLSKSDKAYLKKYSKIFVTKGETKHKIYYALIDNMEEYSFQVLKKKLDKHGSYRRFKNAEHELYHQILEDLVVLKSKKRPTWQYYIEHMKLGYLFLGSKHEEALKQFDVMDKLRIETKNNTIDYLYHKFHYHHLASLSTSRGPKELEKLSRVEDELRQSVEDLKLEFLLVAAVFNMENYRRSSFNKTHLEFNQGLESFLREYVDVLPKTLETDKWKMLSVYYYFFCNYFLTISSEEGLDDYSKRFYDKFNEGDVKDHFYHEYANAVHFRVQYFLLAKNKEAYKLLDEFKIFIDRDDFFELKSFFYNMYCQLALAIYVKFEDLKVLEVFVKNEKENYDLILKSSSHRVALATNLYWAVSYTKLKKYKESQVYLDRIFDYFGKIQESSNKILIYSRILDILIHFELKNYENIKYYIDNLEKEMERNNQILKFDKMFFSHLRKMNQQLYAQQEYKKDGFLEFLNNQRDEDRMDSYVSYLNLKDWLEKFEV